MATHIKLPKLTWTMEEGTVGKWLKKEGEEVKEGDPVCEVETEKTTDMIEAPTSGILRKILVQEGALVPVNQTIAVITEPDEKLSDLADLEKQAKEAVRKLSKIEREETKETVGEERKPAKKRIKISPLARKLAEKHGVDISSIEGSGPGGRIIKRDIQKALKKAEAEEVIPVKGMRKTIMKRLKLSARTALHVPIVTEVDVTEMVNLRKTLLSDYQEEGLRPTYTDILTKAAAKALKKHPIVNSRMEEEHIKLLKEINIGVAVALEQGLIVPVIPDADKKTIKEIAVSRKQLIEKARKGELLTRETSGGTFTLSNLGMFDIDIFVPIINPPESAILGIGRIIDKPVVANGDITVRPVMTLCLVFDHRIMDGAKAAQFLKTLTELLKNPYLLLA